MIRLYKLWAKLTGQKLVWLKDHDNEVSLSFARKTGFGWVAKRCGNPVLLNEDGTCSGRPYVKFWTEEV